MVWVFFTIVFSRFKSSTLNLGIADGQWSNALSMLLRRAGLRPTCYWTALQVQTPHTLTCVDCVFISYLLGFSWDRPVIFKTFLLALFSSLSKNVRCAGSARFFQLQTGSLVVFFLCWTHSQREGHLNISSQASPLALLASNFLPGYILLKTMEL